MRTIHDIKFDKHGGKFGNQLGLYMPGHYWVPKAEIELAWDIANAHLPDIDWTKRVYSETIFTTDIWEEFKKPTKLMLGRCLKYFSVHGMLPIEVANPGKKGKIFYKQKR